MVRDGGTLQSGRDRLPCGTDTQCTSMHKLQEQARNTHMHIHSSCTYRRPGSRRSHCAAYAGVMLCRKNIFNGAAVAFFSFIGFDALATTAEEQIKPER